MSIKAIIIDDEERGRASLSTLLDHYCPEVIILDACSNVPDGVISINKHKPELVFLDVEMPVYNGFELLNFFDTVKFEIIFVTAYSEYALKAFEVSAIDYILKPVDINQLKRSVAKFKNRKKQNNIINRIELMKENLTAAEIKRIAVPMNDGLVFLELKDIVLLKADGSYTKVYLANGSTILVSKKLKFFEDLLIDRVLFYRSHRSHLVNLNFIKKYLKGEGSIIMDNGKIVSVSRDKKSEFEERLKDLKIS